jgi:alpha/beta hydrolase family protein
MKLLPRLLLSTLILSLTTVAHARVINVQVLSRTQISADLPGVPPYEKIVARVNFAVSPSNAYNRPIVDLDRAARNAQGEVEFSADLFLLRPISQGNNAMLLEIPNRGGKGILGLVDGGKSDIAAGTDLGDAWLLRKGFTIASLGWQWDVAGGSDNLRLYAPVAYESGGRRITGLLRDDFTLTEAATEVPLGHIMGSRLGGTEYPAAAPDDVRNVLTVRDTPHGPRTVIPRSQWSFAHAVDGKVAPSDRFLRLHSGFMPGKIYELVYVVQDPVVAGLGFAAVRDFVAWEKHAPDAIAPVKLAYAAGISQCGRFLRDFLYEGFNADESGRMALDGVLAHVGGAGRGSFNYRFAQPSRDGQPMSSIDWPTDIFPFTDLPETDPAHPQNGELGLLDAAAKEHVIPKIFFSHTSYEYWGRAASLIHTTADGKADAPISPNVRIYYYCGLQHYSVAFPPTMGTGDRASEQLPSPLPIRWFWRAMIANMDAWVRSGAEPPPSRYPKIADGTLVPLNKLAFPSVPGANEGDRFKPPSNDAQGWDLNFGSNWRAGVLSQQPPTVGYDYRALVPQVDADGNDLGGIRLPEIAAPLATYTGWNLRTAAIGAPGERLAFLGSFVPLRRTAEEAASVHDSRAAIDDRYKSYSDYRARFQRALDGLIRERYILAEDGGPLMDRSQQEWDWITRYGQAKK